jgi:hypothetical protein
VAIDEAGRVAVADAGGARLFRREAGGAWTVVIAFEPEPKPKDHA